MDGVYETRLTLKSRDVDPYQNIRLSKLAELLQEASIAHTEELGFDRTKTLDKGLLWIIIQQRLQIRRLPRYDETVVVKSWPGEMMHVLFPRYYQVETEAGEVLVRSSALWMLISSETRGMIFPEQWGVIIGGVTTGEEIPLPETVQPLECHSSATLNVGFSLCDLNGHMNNTRYFDLAADRIPDFAAGKMPKEIGVQYTSEARLGTVIRIGTARTENGWAVTGDGEKNIFRMKIVF